MAGPATPVSEAERHVRACEEIVGRQLELVNELHIADRPAEATKARDVLALLIDMLEAARRHLESERRRVVGQAPQV